MKHDLTKCVLGVSAGVVKNLADAQRYLPTAATRITAGAFTLPRRIGNVGEPRYWFDEVTGAGYNALGMPNDGTIAVTPWLRAFTNEAGEAGKQVVANVAGFSPEEYAKLATAYLPVAHRVELNAGCPNVYGASGRKPIPSKEPGLLREILRQVKEAVGDGDGRIGIKISPFEDTPEDTALFEEIASIIGESGIISEVVAVNTKGGQRPKRPDGTDALSFSPEEGAPLQHEGGMSGKPLKEYGLRAVGFLTKVLPAYISVIGCGGVDSGQDLLDYLDRNAGGAVLTTGQTQYGHGIYSRILSEGLDLLEKRAA